MIYDIVDLIATVYIQLNCKLFINIILCVYIYIYIYIW